MKTGILKREEVVSSSVSMITSEKIHKSSCYFHKIIFMVFHCHKEVAHTILLPSNTCVGASTTAVKGSPIIAYFCLIVRFWSYTIQKQSAFFTSFVWLETTIPSLLFRSKLLFRHCGDIKDFKLPQ